MATFSTIFREESLGGSREPQTSSADRNHGLRVPGISKQRYYTAGLGPGGRSAKARCVSPDSIQRQSSLSIVIN